MSEAVTAWADIDATADMSIAEECVHCAAGKVIDISYQILTPDGVEHCPARGCLACKRIWHGGIE